MTGRPDRKRGPYKPTKADELARLEQRRKRAGVTIDALAERAGMTARTLYRIRRTGLAFPRQVMALRMALRAIEKDRKLRDQLYPAGDGAPEAVGGSQSAGRKT